MRNCVVYVGYRLRGGLGALVSAVGVLLPTFVLIVALIGLYVTYASKVAVLSNLFAGCMPAVAAVIVSVVHRMAKNILKGHREVILTILAVLALLVAPRAIRLYITQITALYGMRSRIRAFVTVLRTSKEYRPRYATPVIGAWRYLQHAHRPL
jgi:chromate transporter